jgi:hypothetical protein
MELFNSLVDKTTGATSKTLSTEILLKWQLNENPMPKDYYSSRRTRYKYLVQELLVRIAGTLLSV